MAITGTITGTTKRAGMGLARPFTAVSLTPADATVSPTSGTTASDGTVTLTVTAVAAGTAVVRFTSDGISADCVVTVASAATLGKLVADGDSIIAGYLADGSTSTALPLLSYAAGVASLYGLTPSNAAQYANVATPGQTAAQMRSAATDVTAAFSSAAGPCLLLVQVTVNDFAQQIAASSPADLTTALADVRTYCLAHRAEGYKVVLVPDTPNLSSNTDKQPALSVACEAYNSLLLTHAPEFADALVTWGSAIDARATSADTTKYVDGIHPTAAYHAGALATAVKVACDVALAGGYYTGVAPQVDAVTISSPADAAALVDGAAVTVTGTAFLNGASITGDVKSIVIVSGGSGVSVSGTTITNTTGGSAATLTYKLRSTKGGLSADSLPRTIALAGVATDYLTATFTGADGAVVAAETGQTWTEGNHGTASTWQNLSNHAYVAAGGGGYSFLTADAAHSDGTMEWVIDAWADNNGLVFGYSDNANFHMLQRESGGVKLYDRISGSWNVPAGGSSDAFTPVTGGVLQIVRSGTNMTVKYNGTTILTFASLTKTGTRMGLASAGSASTTRWDSCRMAP